MKHIDVIIIGAGAAGLMCAITAGQRGRQVLVLDHSNKPGKKILMSGGGRCNFTNIHTRPDNFISHNPHFCKSALSRYTPNDFIERVKKHNIPFHEKKLGQLFCDNSSKDILTMLLIDAQAAYAKIQLNTEIISITQQENFKFHLKTSQGSFTCESLVIATGGLSIPTMKSSPFGYQIAKQFNINVYPTRAGLVPFTLHEQDKKRLSALSGVSVDCQVSVNNTTFDENLLFTHRGLSGPAMLQISSYWQPGQTLNINLLPAVNLTLEFEQAKSMTPKITLKNFLSRFLAKRLIEIWLDSDILSQTLVELSNQSVKQITQSLTEWQLTPNNTEGYRTAEVTLGGVDCNGISSKTFECLNTPGLYFIGEVLDMTGWLGGYNFQWAWASGFAAGSYV